MQFHLGLPIKGGLSVLYTEDKGNRWEMQKGISGGKLMDVQAFKDGSAWIVEESGKLFRTCDNGKTWILVKVLPL
jgi:photosystem II stability/assembly factor-like uncharacterized protein